MKPTCPEPFSQKEEYTLGITKLILAKIPLQEFTPYWEPAEYDLKFHERFERVQNDAGKKYGWTRHEFSTDVEVHHNWPTHLDHKYFSVEHREI